MAELAAQVKALRDKYPKYDITPRPDDGKNLALSVAKWEGRAGIPGKPFVVWAVGASWTAGLGSDGKMLEYAIRQRFPQAPPIVYRMFAGSGTPWNYARGWVKQFVIPDQPDLILTYTNGDPKLLDMMLAEIRATSTADIIVPTLHLLSHEDSMAPDFVERGTSTYGDTISAIRDICSRWGVEFVENRREMAAYLHRIGQSPAVLRSDSAHQNEYGVLRTWDNITRHIAKPKAFNYAPQSRERRLPVSPAARTATENVELSAGWTLTGGVARTDRAGERIKIRFTANRIDLLGQKRSGGGSVKVWIDGVPAEQAPAFFTSRIEVQPVSWPWKFPDAGVGDIGPHSVDLGDNLVPQTWTITMTDDNGNYLLSGSVTGPDGQGNAATYLHSWSGQISIDPALWRYNFRDGVFGNRKGDKYVFQVYRNAVGTVRFAAPEAGPFNVPLVQNLPVGTHTLEIEAQGDGEVIIDSFYVYQPPGR